MLPPLYFIIDSAISSLRFDAFARFSLTCYAYAAVIAMPDFAVCRRVDFAATLLC